MFSTCILLRLPLCLSLGLSLWISLCPATAGADPGFMEWPTLQGAGTKKASVLFNATFQKNSSPLPDDANTLLHVTSSGTAAVDSKGATVTNVGAPTFNTTSQIYDNGWSASPRAGISGFAAGKYLTLPNSSLSTSSPYLCCVRYGITTRQENYLLSNWNTNNGYFLDVARTFNPGSVIAGIGTSAGGQFGQVGTGDQQDVIGAYDLACGGFDASNIYARTNLSSTATTAHANAYVASPNLVALGAKIDGTGNASGVTLYEAFCEQAAWTDTYVQSLGETAFGMVADTGQHIHGTRAATATDTVKGSSVTFPFNVLRINESGMYLAASGEYATIDTAGVLDWSKQRVTYAFTPDWSASTASVDRTLFDDGPHKLKYLASSQVFQLTAGGVTVSTAAQSFSAGTQHTVVATWQNGSGCSIQVDAAAAVPCGTPPASDLPNSTAYVGGDATNPLGGRVQQIKIEALGGAQSLAYPPLGATYAFNANNIDGSFNTTLSSGSLIGTWHRDSRIGSGACSTCANMANATTAEQPIARLYGSNWTVTADGVQDFMAAGSSGTDLNYMVTSGVFDMVVLMRHASDRVTQQGSTTPGQAPLIAGTVPSPNSMRWLLDDAGASNFVLENNGGTNTVSVTGVGGAEPVGTWSWTEISGDGSTLYASNDLSTYATAPFTGSKSISGVLQDLTIFGQSAAFAYKFDGDIAFAAIYPRKLSSTERANLKAWASQRWTGSASTLVAALGDSITGTYETASNIPWPKRIELAKGSSYQVANYGVFGDTAQLAVGRWEGEIRGRGFKYIIEALGVNDIKNGIENEAQIEAAISTIDTEAVADGMTVIHVTVLPWKNFTGWSASLQTMTLDVNAWKLAQCAADQVHQKCFDAYSRYGDGVSQPFGESGGDPQALALTCDMSDGLHPKDPCVPDIATQIGALLP